MNDNFLPIHYWMINLKKIKKNIEKPNRSNLPNPWHESWKKIAMSNSQPTRITKDKILKKLTEKK